MKRSPLKRRTPLKAKSADSRKREGRDATQTDPAGGDSAKGRATHLKAVSPKPAKCRTCGEAYTRERTRQKTCSVPCAIALVEQERIEKAVAPYRPERGGLTKAVRDHRASDRATLIKAAQREFNRWIRLVRDDGMPCQSCGKPLPRGPSTDKEAGHYKSRGAHGRLRFDESNVLLECHGCNHHSDSHLLGLRESIVRRFGQAEVDRLESSGGPRKFTLEELRDIRAEYRRRNKEAGVS